MRLMTVDVLACLAVIQILSLVSSPSQMQHVITNQLPPDPFSGRGASGDSNVAVWHENCMLV